MPFLLEICVDTYAPCGGNATTWAVLPTCCRTRKKPPPRPSRPTGRGSCTSTAPRSIWVKTNGASATAPALPYLLHPCSRVRRHRPRHPLRLSGTARFMPQRVQQTHGDRHRFPRKRPGAVPVQGRKDTDRRCSGRTSAAEAGAGGSQRHGIQLFMPQRV